MAIITTLHSTLEEPILFMQLQNIPPTKRLKSAPRERLLISSTLLRTCAAWLYRHPKRKALNNNLAHFVPNHSDEKLHFDVLGLCKLSIDKCKFLLVGINELSRFGFCIPRSKKNSVGQIIINFIKRIETGLQYRCRCLKTDNGEEILGPNYFHLSTLKGFYENFPLLTILMRTDKWNASIAPFNAPWNAYCIWQTCPTTCGATQRSMWF